MLRTIKQKVLVLVLLAVWLGYSFNEIVSFSKWNDLKLYPWLSILGFIISFVLAILLIKDLKKSAN